MRGTILRLEAALRDAGTDSRRTSRPFVEEPTLKSLRETVETLGGGEVRVNEAQAVDAVREFLKTGVIASLRDRKYICYGAATRHLDLGSVVLLPERWATLRAAVCAEAEPRRRLRCLQALLSSYWRYPRFDAADEATMERGFRELRTFCGSEYAAALERPFKRPTWLDALRERPELLGENPASEMGAVFADGFSDRATALFKDACGRIGVPIDSWLKEAVALAAIARIVERDDAAFRASVALLLEMIGDDRFLGEALRRRALGMTLDRYSRCVDRPPHRELCRAAVAVIGNPWVESSRWRTFVLTPKGEPSEDARRMVDRWLKDDLIERFFTSFLAEGRADRRRLGYWLGMVDHIEQMWFVLGRSFLLDGRKETLDFRERAQNLIISLYEDQTAFVMKVKGHYLVEFGNQGNALYVYTRKEMEKTFGEYLSGTSRTTTIAELKSGRTVDRPYHSGDWETRFDEKLENLLRISIDRGSARGYS